MNQLKLSPAEENRDFEWALAAGNAIVEGSEVRCCGREDVVEYLEELHSNLHPAEKKTCKENAALPENCLRQVVISMESVSGLGIPEAGQDKDHHLYWALTAHGTSVVSKAIPRPYSKADVQFCSRLVVPHVTHTDMAVDLSLWSCPQQPVHLTHDAVLTAYMRPTDCAHCDKMLLGLKNQGWKCKACKKDFHNACLALCNCEFAGREQEKSPRPSNNARTLQPESCLNHRLEETTFMKPTDCQNCKKMLVGFTKQGLKCSACELAFHKGDHPCSTPNQICPVKYLPLLSQAQEEGVYGKQHLPGAEGQDHTLLGVVRLNLQDLTTEAARLAADTTLTMRLEAPHKDHPISKFYAKGAVPGSVRLSASLQMAADPPKLASTISHERYLRYVQRVLGSRDWALALQPATAPFSLLHACSLRARVGQTHHVMALVNELMETLSHGEPKDMGNGGELGAVALLLERLDTAVTENMRKKGRPDSSTLVQLSRLLQNVIDELTKVLRCYHNLAPVSSKFVFFHPTSLHAGQLNFNRSILILNAKDSPLNATERRMDDALSALKWVWAIERTMGGLINITQGMTLEGFVKTELTRLTNDLLTSQQPTPNQRGSINNLTLLDQLTETTKALTAAVNTDSIYAEVIRYHTGGFDIRNVTYDVAQKLDMWVRQALRSLYSSDSQDNETQELAVQGTPTPLNSPIFCLYSALKKLKDALQSVGELAIFIDLKIFYPAVETVLQVCGPKMEKSVEEVMQSNRGLDVEFSDKEFETRHAASAQDTFLAFGPLIDFLNRIEWDDRNTLETFLVRFSIIVSKILIKYVSWVEGRVVELHREQHEREGRLVSAPLCVGMNTVQYVVVHLPGVLDGLSNKLPASVYAKVLEAIMTESESLLGQQNVNSPNEAMMRDTFIQTLTALLSSKKKFSNYIIYEYGNVMDETLAKLLHLDAPAGFGAIFGKAKQLLKRDIQKMEQASVHGGLMPEPGRGLGDSRFRASVMGRVNHTLPPKKQAQLDELIDFITEVLSLLASSLDTSSPTWAKGDDLTTELVQGLWDTNVDSMKITIDDLKASKDKSVPTAEQYQWAHATMHQLYELFNSNEDGVEAFPAKKLNSPEFRELMAMLRRGSNPQL